MATTQSKQPVTVPTPNVAGYPQTGIKTTGIKIRGTGAATKGKTARGPMA
jgi:hypothetical protein